MQKIFLLSLLVLACSRLNEVEFGKDLYFDINNNKFEFTSQTSGALFVSAKMRVYNLVELHVSDGSSSESHSIDKNGAGTIMFLNKGRTYKIELRYYRSSSKNGTVWINPSTNEVKVIEI